MEGGYGSVLSNWSWGENKLFELALAVVDESNPKRWEVIASMVGGKSAEDVEKQYKILLEDLESIESGNFDDRLQDSRLYLSVEYTKSMYWTDEDQKMLVRLDLNCSSRKGK